MSHNVRVFRLENSALVWPSSRGKRDRHLGPVVQVPLVLRHFGVSDHGVPRWSSLMSLREFSLTLARSSRGSGANYADVEGMREHGYVAMPPIDLAAGEASALKAPALPSKPLKKTSRLNGRAYVAAGQAGAALHTMSVLQAYQANLLKDLDKGQGVSPDAMDELCRTTDLALRATAASIGRSMAEMVAAERHL
ncbi:hypothetical protein PO909_022742 [Leuciscus waleckii]